MKWRPPKDFDVAKARKAYLDAPSWYAGLPGEFLSPWYRKYSVASDSLEMEADQGAHGGPWLRDEPEGEEA